MYDFGEYLRNGVFSSVVLSAHHINVVLITGGTFDLARAPNVKVPNGAVDCAEKPLI